MKLLILTNNPDRSSFKDRIGVYLDILKANGIDCEIATLPSFFLKRRILYKHAQKFDAVFLHKKGLNFFDAGWLKKYAKKIIYNFDDAVMYSDKTPEKDSLTHFLPWQRSVKLADMVLVGSRYLAEHALKFNGNVEILPLGLRVNFYNVAAPAKMDDKMRLVWIGSESTLMYLEQIKPVIEAVGLRFSNVVLRIIGDTFFDMPNMQVEKLQWSMQTRALGLVESNIGLAPLPSNRFTEGKCSFKVLEYSASGIPVVASPVGTNSLYVRDGITGFLATDMQQWIDRISQLIENPQLRETMGEQGRKCAREFDVSVIGAKLAKLIKSI